MKNPDKINYLKGLLSSSVDTHVIVKEVAKASRSVSRQEMFDWMLESLTNDSDGRAVDTLLGMIPVFTSRENEGAIISYLKELVHDKRASSNPIISRVLLMLERANGRFDPNSVLRFLCWCIQHNHMDITEQFFEIVISYITQLKDEEDIIEGMKLLRTKGDNAIRVAATGMESFLRHAHVRSAYRTILLTTDVEEYRCLDVIAFLVLSHIYDGRDAFEHLHYRALPVVISTMQRIGLSSYASRSTFVPALMDLGIYFLLSPIRINYPQLDLIPDNVTIPLQECMLATKQFFQDLFLLLPLEHRQSFISKILNLPEIRFPGHNTNVDSSLLHDFDQSIPPSTSTFMKAGNGAQTRIELRRWRDMLISSLIMVISIIRTHQTLIGMEIVQHRLEVFSQQLWYQESEKDSRTISTDFECAMAELYCIAFTEYIGILSTAEKTCNEVDGVRRVQKLLHSFWDLDVSKRASMEGRDRRVVLGLILSRTLIQSKNISKADCVIILEWVVRILRGDGMDTWGIAIDAVTAYWGLIFLYSLCPELDGYSLHQRYPMLIHVDSGTRNYTCSSSEILVEVKSFVIARLGLIKFESELDNKGGENSVRYVKIPSCFGAESKKEKRRTFCIATFLSRLSAYEKNSLSAKVPWISEWFQTINCSTDLYFKLARTVSGNKWTVNSWLMASIELCSCSNQNTLDLPLSYMFGRRFERNEENNMMTEVEPGDVNHATVTSFLQRSYAFAFAVSVCSAVLNNAYNYDYIERKAPNMGVLMQLMQFQLAKLYDLNYHFHTTLDVIQDHLLGSVNLQENEEKGRNGTFVPVEKIRSLLSTFFTSQLSIPLELLWNSIDTIAWDLHRNKWEALLKSIRNKDAWWKKNYGSLTESLESFLHSLNLQSSTLQHLQSRLAMLAKCATEVEHDYGEQFIQKLQAQYLSTEGAARLFCSARTMMLWMPLCKQFFSSEAYLSGIAQSSRGLLAIEEIHDRIQNCVISSLSIVKNIIEKNRGVAPSTNDNIGTLFATLSIKNEYDEGDATSGHSSFIAFLKRAVVSDNVLVLSHMLDIAYLVAEEECKSNDYVRTITWNYLIANNKSQVKNSASSTRLPVPLPIMRCISTTNVTDTPTQDMANKVFLSLLRKAKAYLHSPDENALICHNLLRHWSHEISKPDISKLCDDFELLTRALKLTLKDMQNSSAPSSLKRSRCEEEDKSFVPADLNAVSLPAFHDILLHLTIAMVVINENSGALRDNFSLSDIIKRRQRFLTVVECFGNLVALFASNFDFFPKSTTASVMKCCLLAIRLCEHTINNYAAKEMKNDLPKQRTSTAIPIKDLIQSTKRSFCDQISALCDVIINASLTRQCRRLVLSLVDRNKNMRDFLFSLEGSFNLLPSTLMVLPGSEFDADTKYPNRHERKSRQSKKVQKQDTRCSGVESIMEDFVGLTNNSSDDDSFGATGDWGDDAGKNTRTIGNQ